MLDILTIWVSAASTNQVLIIVVSLGAIVVFSIGSGIYWRYALNQQAIENRLGLALSPTARQYGIGAAASATSLADGHDKISVIVRLLSPLAFMASKIPIYGQSDRDKLEKNLTHAGIRIKDAVSIGMAFKFLFSIIIAGSTWFIMASRDMFVEDPVIRIVVMAVGFIVGSNIPDYIVALLARRRRMLLEDSVTDAVDLMVICAEAGLTIDTLIQRVAKELRASHHEFAVELELASAELNILPDRREALDNLYARTGVEDLKTLAMILSQGEKYGTPLAQSFRTIAAEGRKHKMVRLEIKAAKLPAYMTLPMMVFIMPTVMVIVSGPSVYKIFELLGN